MSDIGFDIEYDASRGGRGTPFEKGQSGNPAGRPPGSRNKATLAAAVLLDGEAERLTRRAVERALDGSDLALKVCLERILPARRERSVAFALPPIDGPGDLVAALRAVLGAVADGELTPGEALRLSQSVQIFLHAIETGEFERRLRQIEARDAPRP